MIDSRRKDVALVFSHSIDDERDLKNLRLADIEIISTLGVGGFGRVELVILIYSSMIVYIVFTSIRFKIHAIRINTV